MKIARGNRRQLLLWGGLAVVLVLALVQTQKRTSTTHREGAGGSHLTSGRYRDSSEQENSNLEKALSLVGVDFERTVRSESLRGPNIFGELRSRAGNSPVPAVPPTVARPAPAPPVLTDQKSEVTFKLLGTFGPSEQPIAALAQAGRVLNAREGDVVFGQFRIVKVGHESVDIGFGEGALSETQRIGFQP